MVKRAESGTNRRFFVPGRWGRSRGIVLLLAVSIVLSAGFLIRGLPGDWSLTTEAKKTPPVASERIEQSPSEPLPPLFSTEQWRVEMAGVSSVAIDSNPQGHADQQLQQQVRVLFEHGANLLRQGELVRARQALEMLIKIAPKLPQAYVNLGFVLYEQGSAEAALRAFNHAAELNAYQSNAYYGAALAYERLQDIEAAMGQMRSFIHLSQPDNRFLAKARAALWEWESMVAEQRLGQGSQKLESRVSVSISSRAGAKNVSN